MTTQTDNEMQVHDPIPNTIVTDGNMTGPSLDLDQDWPELDQLRWLAGVVNARTGLDLRITTGGVWRNDRPVHGFGYGLGRSNQGGSMDFHSTWLFLVGIEIGAEAVAR